MTLLSYPSRQFPAEPQVTLEVPDGWEPVATVSTRLAAREVGNADFHTNVVVVVDRRPSGTEAEVALSELAAEAARRPDGQVSESFKITAAGREWVGCDLSWTDATVGRILQVHLFSVVPAPDAEAPVFLVQLTGSCPESVEATAYPVIQQALSSVQVTPWAG